SWMSGGMGLLVAVRDAAAAEVVRRELDLHPVARRDADVVHPHLPGYVSKNLVPVLQLDTEHGVRQRLHDRPFDQDRVILRLGQRASPSGLERAQRTSFSCNLGRAERARSRPKRL